MKISLLGTPSVKNKKDEEIKFPYKKVEALFYYLLVKKKTSRTKLATLLWGNMPENKAKKNLRNALYQLKKSVGEDIISTPDRFIVKIVKVDSFSLDLAKFLEKEAKEALKLYQGSFLKGLLIKNASDFNNWLIEQRNYYEQLYINYLKKEIRVCKKAKKTKKAVSYLESLIKIDPFNERAYRELMLLYFRADNSAKAIEVFKKLETELKQELGITPDQKTIALLQKIRDKISNAIENNKQKNNFMFRKKEIKKVIANLNQFNNQKNSYSFLVSGEAGIGKTALIEQVISLADLKNALVLKTNCYQAEENYVFKPWKTIMQQLKEEIDFDQIKLSPLWKKVIFFLFPSFLPEEEISFDKMVNFDSIQYQSVIEAMLFVLSEAAAEKKIIIFFEDLHWCDEKSLLLLRNLIRENKNENIIILATSRNQRWQRLENIFSDLKEANLLKNIKLQRLKLKEVKEFSQRFLPNYQFTEELFTKIHKETEGNLFFLVEFLNLLMKEKDNQALTEMLTAKSKNILSSRFSSVSREAQKILIIASICFDNFSYDLLAAVSGKKELKLIEIFEELQSFNLINEVEVRNNNRSLYKFTHTKLREFVYNKQSKFKVKILHKRIAQFIENDFKKQSPKKKQYSKLIYHYSLSGDKLKYLFYLIKEAENYIHYTHEIFPIANDQKLARDNVLYLNKEKSQNYLAKIESLFTEIKNSSDLFPDLKNMEAKYLNLKAHFLIGKGKYIEALQNLKLMLKNAYAINNSKIKLNAYEQLAALGIQLEDFSLIRKNAIRMNQSADKLGFKTKKGIALRFLGIFNLYNKNYELANNYFKKSLNVFKSAETITKKYTLGIATAYNYLGEVERYQGNFKKANQYYNCSIDLCEKKNILSGLGIFYINSGQVYYEEKQFKLAEKQFLKSLDIYNELATVWGYSTISYSYLSLICLNKAQYFKAYSYLENASSMLDSFYKRYWYGIFLRAEAEISRKMTENKKIKDIFLNKLTLNYQEYAEKAVSIFKDIGANYELAAAENLIKS